MIKIKRAKPNAIIGELGAINCKWCNTWKVISEFHKSCKVPGYSLICKNCNSKNKKRKKLENYGLSASDLKWMILNQNNKCKICGINFDQTTINKRINIDHNHKTNEVRGLLCINCNLGLGYFMDNHNLLFKADQYLNTPNIKTQIENENEQIFLSELEKTFDHNDYIDR